MSGRRRSDRASVTSVHLGIRITPTEHAALLWLLAAEKKRSRIAGKVTVAQMIRYWIRRKHGWAGADLSRLHEWSEKRRRAKSAADD